MTFPHTIREWFTFAERSVLRFLMTGVGLALMIVGLALGVTMVMLPAGLVIGLVGVALFVWGVLGEMPIEKDKPRT